MAKTTPLAKSTAPETFTLSAETANYLGITSDDVGNEVEVSIQVESENDDGSFDCQSMREDDEPEEPGETDQAGTDTTATPAMNALFGKGKKA